MKNDRKRKKKAKERQDKKNENQQNKENQEIINEIQKKLKLKKEKYELEREEKEKLECEKKEIERLEKKDLERKKEEKEKRDKIRQELERIEKEKEKIKLEKEVKEIDRKERKEIKKIKKDEERKRIKYEIKEKQKQNKEMEEKKIKDKEIEEYEKIKKEVAERFNQIEHYLPSPFKLGFFEIKDLIKDNNDKCIICQKGYNVEIEVIRLNCSHLFHKECIIRWFIKNDSCPLCKEYCFEEPDLSDILCDALFNFRKEYHGNYLQIRELYFRSENFDDFLRRVANDEYVEIDYNPNNYNLPSFDSNEDVDEGEDRFI